MGVGYLIWERGIWDRIADLYLQELRCCLTVWILADMWNNCCDIIMQYVMLRYVDNTAAEGDAVIFFYLQQQLKHCPLLLFVKTEPSNSGLFI